MRVAAESLRRGFGLTLGVACVAVLVLIAGALLGITLRETRMQDQDLRRRQTAWLLEAGFERAAASLAADERYAGENWSIAPNEMKSTHGGRVAISVEVSADAPRLRRVRVNAFYPSDARVPVRIEQERTIALSRIDHSEKSP